MLRPQGPRHELRASWAFPFVQLSGLVAVGGQLSRVRRPGAVWGKLKSKLWHCTGTADKLARADKDTMGEHVVTVSCAGPYWGAVCCSLPLTLCLTHPWAPLTVRMAPATHNAQPQSRKPHPSETKPR